jgi:hypothetical protein
VDDEFSKRLNAWTRQLGEVMRKNKNKIVDDFCDEHNIDDEKRKQFKKVVPIRIY